MALNWSNVHLLMGLTATGKDAVVRAFSPWLKVADNSFVFLDVKWNVVASVRCSASSLLLLAERLVPHESVHVLALQNGVVGIVWVGPFAEEEVLFHLWLECLSSVFWLVVFQQSPNRLAKINF